jgi:hypothetical protein
MSDETTACDYDPSGLVNVPLGMFHCPNCGQMVVAGLPHPDYSHMNDPDLARICKNLT